MQHRPTHVHNREPYVHGELPEHFRRDTLQPSHATVTRFLSHAELLQSKDATSSAITHVHGNYHTRAVRRRSGAHWPRGLERRMRQELVSAGI